jgi:LuxR family maltose regulon positive regulatory protein
MAPPLLTTKFYIPPVRSEVVSRPRLIERLNAGVHRKLTLVSAPAGFGKTTLIAEWIHGLGAHHYLARPALAPRQGHGGQASEPGKGRDAPRQVAWLSLDEGDNDPVLFLHCLIAALQRLDETIGQGAQSLLQSPQLSSGQGLATQLLNDISTFPSPFILVLDDYQAIRRAEIHEMLGFLIDNQPPQMHTVIATRRDPRLPLARWRARGESTEIRASDLRFTVEEARDFLNQRMGLDLTAGLVEALEARTEGWIAGLQLAALALQGTISLRGSHDPADVVRQFSGSDRYVIDYLVEEVLQRQPAHVRRFLQQTAVLKELSAPLCDYVRFGEAKPRTGWEDSATILREVERANLFLIPLDNRREWYRYHHLFAEVLATTGDEGETQALHRRAASWYEAHGRLSRAIRHALAGGDLKNVVRLIKVAAPDQLQHGGFVRVLSWLDALPDEVVRSDTELATYKGYILLWRGEIEAAESYADAAEGSLPQEAPAATRGRLLTLRAHLCSDRGPKLIHYATEAIELMDESTPFFYGAALLMLAVGHKMSGNVAEMMDIYCRLARLEKQRNPFMAATAIAEMADVLRLQGKRREALALCQRAMEEYTDGRGRLLPSLIVVLLIDAMLAHEANELTLALQRAEQCATMAQQTGMSFIAAQCKCFVDVPCRWALGERGAAWAALQEARELIADEHPLHLEAHLDAGSWEAWLNLKQGNIPAAARWAATFDFPPGFFHHQLSHVYLMYVRVLLAQDRYQDAAEALQRLEAWARAGRWERVLLSVAILRAIGAQKSGHEASAVDCLAQTLHLAAAEDYLRAFLDEDAVVFELLPRLRAHRGGTVAPVFVDRLLDDFADEGQYERQRPAKNEEKDAHPVSLIAQPLVDPLSERELEVLELLAKGLSTPKIAERLYISAGTAKWHTINIYRKLDVHSRLQAVIRAQELGLI